ncbi:MAG: hypothetical protein E6J10_10845 [Chloroflexi bacterium]|nr:MAG: hypothetical protein E6J10_10845 [Chloroflexota bacterium]
MRAYQPHLSSLPGCCRLNAADQRSLHEQWIGGRCYAVPHLPGRATSLKPYPSSHRRRRR